MFSYCNVLTIPRKLKVFCLVSCNLAYKCDPQGPVCVSNEKTTKLTHEI